MIFTYLLAVFHIIGDRLYLLMLSCYVLLNVLVQISGSIGLLQKLVVHIDDLELQISLEVFGLQSPLIFLVGCIIHQHIIFRLSIKYSADYWMSLSF